MLTKNNFASDFADAVHFNFKITINFAQFSFELFQSKFYFPVKEASPSHRQDFMTVYNPKSTPYLHVWGIVLFNLCSSKQQTLGTRQ